MALRGQLWPRSLQGQLLLAVAVALLLGQSINAFLLLRAQTERRDAALTNTVALRLYGALLDVEDRSFTRGPRRLRANAMAMAFPGSPDGGPPRILPRDNRQPEAETTLRGLLANQGITISEIVVVRRAVASDPIAIRRLARRLELQANGLTPTEVIVAAARRGPEGRWVVARTFIQPPPTGPLVGLIFQTALIYALLVGAIALILQRLTKPLSTLTARVELFGRTRQPAPPLDPAGPEDVRRLIAAHNGLEARLGALLDEKDVMLGAIGHDLKTPLAALRVRIESVGDEGERARMAATIEDIARSLDDILSLARVGRPSDPVEVTDLTALVAQVVEEYEDMDEPVTLADSGRITMPLRPTWVRRALRNLVGNALRYGGAARVTLIEWRHQVEIAVEDDGPGIPEADLARILEPFARGEASRNRATGGAGLGLTLARAIAEQHGGTLVLANRPGPDGRPVGLTVTLTLPRG